MKQRIVVCTVLALLCFCMAWPVFAGSPAKDFDFSINAGGHPYDAGYKQDDAYHADIFPRGGNVSKSTYIAFYICKFQDGELKYLTYRVPAMDLAPMKVYYKNSVNMDDIQGHTLRLYASRYGQGAVNMRGIWYP